MRPWPPTSDEEFRVIRWVFVPLIVLATLFVGAMAFRQSRECARRCAALGFSGSDLVLAGGGRFEMRTECRCVGGPATPDPPATPPN